MAGFSCAAHRQYWMGLRQNLGNGPLIAGMVEVVEWRVGERLAQDGRAELSIAFYEQVIFLLGCRELFERFDAVQSLGESCNPSLKVAVNGHSALKVLAFDVRRRHATFPAQSRIQSNHSKMRWQHFSWLLLALFGLAQALSSSGNRLLVVIDEDDSKDKYSKFFSDLEGISKTAMI